MVDSVKPTPPPKSSSETGEGKTEAGTGSVDGQRTAPARTNEPAVVVRPVVQPEEIPNDTFNTFSLDEGRRASTSGLSSEIDGYLRRPDPLQGGNLFRPRYSMGSIFRPTSFGQTLDHSIIRPDYTGAFDLSQRADISSVLGNASAGTGDVDRVSGYLDTPDKVGAFLGNNFTWVDTHSKSTETYSPLTMLRDPRGVCRDQHQFATYALRQNGFEANTVGYGSSGVHHAITTFKDDNGWGIIEYGRVHHVGAPSEEEALSAVIPDALKFWVYGDGDGADDQPGIPVRTIETHAGLELKRFMHLGDGYLHTALNPLGGGPYPGDGTGGSGFRSQFTSNLGSSTVSTGFGDWSLDARMFHGQDPMLQSAFAAAVRWRPDPNVGFSLGVVSMPEAYSYSVGSRKRTRQPLNVAFFGMDGNWDVVDVNMSKNGRWNFRSNLDLRGAIALGFADGLDTGTTAALSHFDVSLRNEVSYRATEGLRLWAAGSAYLPLGDIASYYMTGGVGDVLNAPATLYGEVGADYKIGNFTGGASLYAPLQTRTNLYAEDPRVQLTGAYHLGADTDLVAGAAMGLSGDSFRGAWAGVRYKSLTLAGGVQEGFAGETEGYAQLSVDLFRLIGGNR